MRVHLGKYRSFPLQYAGETLFEKLFGIGLYDESKFTRTHKIAAGAINLVINLFRPIGNWWENTERKCVVKIDPWDTWNVDETLSRIIHPLLVAYKDATVGWFMVEETDAPEHLRIPEWNPNLPKDELLLQRIRNEELEKKRFEWVLDEMIYAFEKVKTAGGWYDNIDERVSNGLRLFGKYFRNLWN